MKKYKLIKEYPGSPKLGTEWEIEKFCSKFWPSDHPKFWEEVKEVKLEVPIGTKFKLNSYFEGTIFSIQKVIDDRVTIYWKTESSTHFTTYSIETVNSHFAEGNWIIYENKEFEILEFKGDGNNIATLQPEGLYCYHPPYSKYFTEEELLKVVGVSILKVKRLSDGVEFKIGDKVYNPSLYCNGEFTITGFCMDCNNIHLLALGGNGGINITKIEYCKQLLFLDELGNEVYEGDEYYYVNSDFRRIGLIAIKRENSVYNTIQYKYFKNKIDAEKYIEDNKPMFSKKQIKDALVSTCTTPIGWTFEGHEFLRKLGL